MMAILVKAPKQSAAKMAMVALESLHYQEENTMLSAVEQVAGEDAGYAYIKHEPPTSQPIRSPTLPTVHVTTHKDCKGEFSEDGTGQGAPQYISPYKDDARVSASNDGEPNTVPLNFTPTPVQPSALPSMLRYVDNHLMRNARLHDRPISSAAMCPVCQYQYDESPIQTTFLPLSPCGHWVHYRCLIWHITRLLDSHDQCPCCYTPLFKWDGISAVTLAARTGLEMESNKLEETYRDDLTQLWCYNDKSMYEADCMLIEMLIRKHFDIQMAHSYTILPDHNLYSLPALLAKDTDKQKDQNPRPADGSPNLVQTFYDIIYEVHQLQRPRGRWLQWNSYMGYLLWTMLISIKMKGFIEGGPRWVIDTQGFSQFEEGRRELQAKILIEVRGDDPKN